MVRRSGNSTAFFFKEIFANLPVVFVFYTAAHLLLSSIEWFDPPKYGWAWTVVFPMFWVVTFTFARLYLNEDIRHRHMAMFGMLVFFATTLVAVLYFGHPQHPTLDQIIYQHEYTTYIWVALLMAHCFLTRGITGFATFFGIGLLYGALLESSGIQYNFFFEPDYHLYAPELLRPIFRAPVTTILGWTTVFYPTYFITEKLFDRLGIRSKIARAFNASLVGLFIDLQVDPVASEIGLWSWNDRLLPGFLGVPTLNFVSWFWAVPTFAFMVFFINSKEDIWSVKKRLLILLVSVPFCQSLSGALTFGTMAILEGLDTPALKILFESLRTQLGQ